MDSSMNRDFVEMLSALSAAGARFLIVGAHALAAHGAPRATGDLDIWIRGTPENAVRVLEALRRFGAAIFDLTVDDLSKPDTRMLPLVASEWLIRSRCSGLKQSAGSSPASTRQRDRWLASVPK